VFGEGPIGALRRGKGEKRILGVEKAFLALSKELVEGV